MYYRAPEVILGTNYSEAIDMWSFGCVVFELRFGKPPFRGKNDQDQLMAIFEFTGLPTKEMLSNSKRASTFFTAEGELRPKITERVPGSKQIKSFIVDQVKSKDYQALDKSERDDEKAFYYFFTQVFKLDP